MMFKLPRFGMTTSRSSPASRAAPDMKRTSILLVCMGNIRRSPTATPLVALRGMQSGIPASERVGFQSNGVNA